MAFIQKSEIKLLIFSPEELYDFVVLVFELQFIA